MAKCTGRAFVRDENGTVLRDTKGRKRTRPCKNDAIHGGDVCRAHGGAAPQVKARAAVRAEVMAWGLGDTHIDPGEILLRLVSQSAARVARYSRELEQLVDKHGGSLETALIGDSMMLTNSGDTVKVGEYIRGLAELEARERDRCANFAAKAVAAGLAERQVRLAEQQAALIVSTIDAVLEQLQLTVEQRATVPAIAERVLRAQAQIEAPKEQT